MSCKHKWEEVLINTYRTRRGHRCKKCGMVRISRTFQNYKIFVYNHVREDGLIAKRIVRHKKK